MKWVQTWLEALISETTQAAYEIHRAHCDNQMFTPGDAPTGCEHLTYQYGHSQSIAPCAEHYTGCPLHAEKKDGDA